MDLIALHGFGGSPADFDVLQSTLHSSLKLVKPPYSKAPPAGYPTSIVLGYSMGARVALSWALGGTLPRALVLIGATAGIEDPRLREARLRKDQALTEEIVSIGSASFADRWKQQPLIATQERMPQPYLHAMQMRRRVIPKAQLTWQLERYGQGAWSPCWDRLAEFNIPALVVAGEEDVRYCHLGRRLAAALPQGQLTIIPNSGHSPHFEAPAAFTEALTRWLRLWADPLIFEV